MKTDDNVYSSYFIHEKIVGTKLNLSMIRTTDKDLTPDEQI